MGIDMQQTGKYIRNPNMLLCRLPLSINADISVVAVQWLHALGSDTGVHPAWEQVFQLLLISKGK